MEALDGREAIAQGTVQSLQEAELDEELPEPASHYEDTLQSEVRDLIVVRLDDGREVTVIHDGSRRYEPGQRVSVFFDARGAAGLP